MQVSTYEMERIQLANSTRKILAHALIQEGRKLSRLQEEILGRRFAWSRWSSVLLLATTFVSFDRFRNPHKRWRFFQMEKRTENKRHISAHQPLTSQSPIGATIPPSPPDFPSCAFREWFSAKHEAGEVVEPYSQACLDGDWEQIHLDWTFSVVATPSRSASLFRSQFCSYMQRTSALTAYFSSKVTNNGD